MPDDAADSHGDDADGKTANCRRMVGSGMLLEVVDVLTYREVTQA
jgi:hypothetical protein